VGSACLIWLDWPTAAYFTQHPISGPVKDFFAAAEQYGMPCGQLLLLALLSWCGLTFPEELPQCNTQRRPGWDPRVVRVFVTGILAGLASNVVKLLISRTRPREFDFEAHASALESFRGVLAFGAGGSAQQGFPSAHSACAFGFAVALATLLPRHRKLLLGYAVLVCLQRIGSGAHFPSDVCFGGLLGYIVGTLYLRNNWVLRIWQGVEMQYLGGSAFALGNAVPPVAPASTADESPAGEPADRSGSERSPRTEPV
jgi:hypothetical protein